MKRTEFYLFIVFTLVLGLVSAKRHGKIKLRKNVLQNVEGPRPKADVPTAEQILGRLLGITKPKGPDATPYATAPQSLSQYPPGSTPQARSPYKIYGSQGATPQTEDNPGPAGYPLPPPPNGYHYGRPRRKRPPNEDEYRADDGTEDEEAEDEEPDPDAEQDDQPSPDDDPRGHSHRRARGRARHLGRNLNQRCGGCKCICWKGIKPHIQWVRVPVCYRPCGVCCPKHEEQGACAAICHQCCNCCCCRPCCHCCHCCHCCRRSMTFRPPLAPPRRVKKLKSTKSKLTKKQHKKSKTSKRKS